MNDTTRRFLSAITERVPEGGRIVELRLFPAIRQGGIESGVAVVAVEPPAVVSASTDGEAEVREPEGDGTAVALVHDAGDASVLEIEDGADASVSMHRERVVARVASGVADDPAAAAALALVDTDVTGEMEDGGSDDEVSAPATYIPNADTSDDETVADALDDEMTTIVVDAARAIRRAESADHVSASAMGTIDDAAVEAREREVVEDADAVRDAATAAAEDSPYADAPTPSDAPRRELLADVAEPGVQDDDPDAMRLDDILALPSPDNTDAAGEATTAEERAAAPRAIHRYAILTASYRLTIKGPDRGKWDVDMIHEADAPLATVERVARGVAKRSGDGSEPEHFSGESLKQALDAPAWIETT